MEPALYADLTPWYHLLDPVEEHADEAACFAAAFARAGASTLLELGAGAGNNAYHLKSQLRCTLSDLSPAMLELSRRQNPTCDHVAGDMRSLRLDRRFDAVLVHDAVCYMASRADLRAAAETAFAHLRPGGVAVFAPDVFLDTFVESTQLIDGDDGQRALRAIEWCWDPDPADEVYAVEYALLLRHGRELRAVHERHVEGLFSRQTWLDVLTGVGFQVEPLRRPIGDGEEDEIFSARRG